MTNAASRSDEYLEQLQRVMRLHPTLVFPDEHVASIKRQIQDLRSGAGGGPGERIILFRTLDLLARSEAPPTMGEISAELGLPLSTATRMADTLVRAHFAERRTDPNDRRVVRLCLTKSGQKFVELATGYVRQRISRLLRHLTADEQEQLLRLITKLIDSVQDSR